MNLKRLYQRLRDPRRAETDLDEEVQSFYDTIEARRVDQGLAPDEAHRMTRAEYGPPSHVIEEVRGSRVEAVFATAIQDLRYAIRLLRKNPGFAAVAVLSLALGIGANTAIYSFMESILLRSLPVADPESLVVLNWHSRPPQDGSKEWVHVIHSVSGTLWPVRAREAKTKNLDGSGLASKKLQPAGMKHTSKIITPSLWQDISSPLNRRAFRRSGLSGCAPGNQLAPAAIAPPTKRL